MRSLKSRCWQGCFPSGSFHCLAFRGSYRLPVFLALWSPQLLQPLTSIVTSPIIHIDIPHPSYWAYLDNPELPPHLCILTLIMSAKSLLLYETVFTVLGIRIWMPFLELLFNPPHPLNSRHFLHCAK